MSVLGAYWLILVETSVVKELQWEAKVYLLLSFAEKLAHDKMPKINNWRHKCRQGALLGRHYSLLSYTRLVCAQMAFSSSHGPY